MPRTPTPDAEPRAPARPRRARPLTLLVGIGVTAALAAITALAAGCGGGPPAARPAGPGVPVAVGEVTREAVPVLVAAIGAVEARSTVSVRPQVGGEVTALHFQAGDDVARGQLLASIDPRTYRANLDQAQAQLERDKVRAANARQDVARYAELVAKDYVTRQQYEQSVADSQALEATLAADQATVENARLDLERATIRAPIGGRTGQQLVYAGNLVKASDDRALVVIQQMEPIDVRFAVPQQFLGEIRARLADRLADGLAVEAALPRPGAQVDPPYRGTLTFIDNAVDSATGTIVLKATFPNHDRALWPGQFVNVALTLSTDADAVVAPASAVETGQNGDYVFVVKPDLSVESRPVTVDRTVGEKAVIAQGLAPGERVVTDGQLRLTPGAKVEIKDEGQAAAAATAAAATAAAPTSAPTSGGAGR